MSEPTPGSMAWVMSAQGVIHRATFLGGPAWSLACRDRRFCDPHLKIMQSRPRDATMCKRCAAALRGAPVHPRQMGLGFDGK